MRKTLIIAAGFVALAAGAAVLPGVAAVDTVVAKVTGRVTIPVPPAHPMSPYARAKYDAERTVALTAPDPVTGLPPLSAMIGQLLVVGFAGDELSDPPAQKLLVDIGDGRVGGILYFAHNVSSLGDVEAMNRAFTAAAPQLPLLIAVDQEGGKVQRLKAANGFFDTPSAAEVAQLSVQERQARYKALAEGLAGLGFNLNLGPVVDLGLEPTNTVVVTNGRTFGQDADAVIDAATDFITAHRAVGIATALKHFPGHGSSLNDSHSEAVDVSATWSPVELAPYAALSKAGLSDMVMVGHLTLDPAVGPVSLAPNAIEAMLRGDLGFDGLTISDDLTMAGAQSGSERHPALDAIMAGNDLIIVSGLMDGLSGDLVDALHRLIADAAEEDPAVRQRITDAFLRVAAFKLDRFEPPARRAEIAAFAGERR